MLFFIIVLTEETPSHDSPKVPMAMIQESNASKNDRFSQRSATDETPTTKRLTYNDLVVNSDMMNTLS